jgi:multicomponent Na+:H+ antiporter subunit D
VAPLAIAIPLLAACLLLAFGTKLPRLATDLVAIAAAAGCLVNAILLWHRVSGQREVYWAGGWRPDGGHGVGIVLVVDPVGAGLAALIALLTGCALLFSWRYFETAEAHLPVLVLLFLTGMTGFVLVGDLFTMFVFFELMGAVACALAGYKIEEPDSVQGAFTFGVTNSLGAYFTLTGIAVLYARTGQLGLAQIGAEIAGHPADVLVRVGFALVCTGWLVKAAAVPFHFWLADAHAVAPSPVCVLFSGVMAPLGVYGIARVYWVSFAGVLPSAAVRVGLILLGVLTAAVGSVMALSQRHLKRMLAYSTIAHGGLFLIALAALSADGIAGAAAYVLGHAGTKGALFLLAGMLLALAGTVDEHDLYGRARGHHVLAALWLLAALALAGLPPFGVGLGKAVAEEATGSPILTAVFVATSAATGGAVLRAGLRIFYGLGRRPGDDTSDVISGSHEQLEVDRPLPATPPTMVTATVLLLVTGLVVGLVPGVAAELCHAAAVFTDSAGYQAAVLGGPVPDVGSVTTHWTLAGVLLGLLSTLAAVAVGVAPLYRRASGLLHRPLHRLHQLHSGHIGDYAAALVLGVAVFTATLVITG